MTCNNCAKCVCKEKKADFEIAMEKVHDLLIYMSEHEDHPQMESLVYPRRVAVGDVYMGIRTDPDAGSYVLIYETDAPDQDPVMYINGTATGLTNPDAPPPLAVSSTMYKSVDQFDTLIRNSFFKG